MLIAASLTSLLIFFTVEEGKGLGWIEGTAERFRHSVPIFLPGYALVFRTVVSVSRRRLAEFVKSTLLPGVSIILTVMLVSNLGASQDYAKEKQVLERGSEVRSTSVFRRATKM